MTYRTALFLAAGTAVFMSAAPTLAGTSLTGDLPRLQFPPTTEVVSKERVASFQVCTQLEKSAKIDPADCGTYSREEIAKIIASQSN